MAHRIIVAVACFMFAALIGVAPVCASPSVRSIAPRLRLPSVTAKTASSGTVNWTQLGFNASHSGYNFHETTIGTSNVGQLQQAWSFSTGPSNVAGNVVESNGVVYAPSSNGTLFAIDAASGTQLWSFATGSGYATSGSAPAVSKGLVFTVCSIASGIQGICAVNASTGTLTWSFAAPGSASYAGTPPVISSGKLYFEGCSSTCSYFALNQITGQVVWSVDTQTSGCEPNGGVTPSVYRSALYVGMFSCQTVSICALSAKDGSQVWCDATSGIMSGMSEGERYVFAALATSRGEQITKYSAADGTQHWTLFLPESPRFVTMPAVAYQRLYFWYVIPSGEGIQALLARNGRGTWGHSPTFSWPSVANGVVYTACSTTPCAFDAKSGALLWGPGSGSPTYGVPIIVNGAVYGACQVTNVCAWTLPSLLRRRI